MNQPLKMMASAALAALLAGIALPSTAAVTAYTTQAAFLAAVSAPGTDSFDDLMQGVSDVGSSRSAGSYAYSATVTGDTFYTVGSGLDTWLSTNSNDDTIVFSGFAANVKGIGAQFFGTDVDGNFVAGQPLLVSITDSTGTTSQTVIGTSTSSFLGFVTTGTLTSMSVQLGAAASGSAWPTVNNLTLAAAVPEPGTYALMALGLAAVLAFVRRSSGHRG